MLPWAVVGVVMVVLATYAVVILFFDDPEDPGEADTVQEVADLAAEAAELFDVRAGVQLLCEQPMDLYRMSVDSTIAGWQDAADTETPDMTYRISDVDDGAAGSFLVDITSDEPGLEDESQQLRVFVESREDRSCIVGTGDADDEQPTTRLSGGGYDGASSPPPSPSPSPSGSSRP